MHTCEIGRAAQCGICSFPESWDARDCCSSACCTHRSTTTVRCNRGRSPTCATQTSRTPCTLSRCAKMKTQTRAWRTLEVRLAHPRPRRTAHQLGKWKCRKTQTILRHLIVLLVDDVHIDRFYFALLSRRLLTVFTRQENINVRIPGLTERHLRNCTACYEKGSPR